MNPRRCVWQELPRNPNSHCLCAQHQALHLHSQQSWRVRINDSPMRRPRVHASRREHIDQGRESTLDGPRHLLHSLNNPNSLRLPSQPDFSRAAALRFLLDFLYDGSPTDSHSTCSEEWEIPKRHTAVHGSVRSAHARQHDLCSSRVNPGFELSVRWKAGPILSPPTAQTHSLKRNGPGVM